MSADFADIAIVDIDLKKTTWSRVHSSMRTLYLKLSAQPDLDWIRFFREERESRIVVKRHGLWIENGYVVFDCLLADVEKHHLPDFRKSIEYANEKSRELKAQRQQERRRLEDDERDEERRLRTLRAHIRGESSAGARAASGSARAADPVAPGRAPAKAATTKSADAGFESRRIELRTRFRAALKSRKTESDRGND